MQEDMFIPFLRPSVFDSIERLVDNLDEIDKYINMMDIRRRMDSDRLYGEIFTKFHKEYINMVNRYKIDVIEKERSDELMVYYEKLYQFIYDNRETISRKRTFCKITDITFDGIFIKCKDDTNLNVMTFQKYLDNGNVYAYPIFDNPEGNPMLQYRARIKKFVFCSGIYIQAGRMPIPMFI